MDFKQYIDFASAALIPLIAIITIYIAYQQYRTNKLKLRHDLFEKRWSVYKTLMESLEAVIREGTINDDKLFKLNIERIKSYFLFDQDLYNYIDEIYDKLIDLQTMNSASEQEKVANAQKRSELKKWFFAQIRASKEKFYKFLNMES